MTALKKDSTPYKRVPRKVAAEVAPKKAPAKRAPRAPKAAPESAPAEVATDTTTVTLLDREVAVRPPTGEQLIAWDAILGKIAKMNDGNATMEDAKKAINRLYLTINSVLVDEDDKEWVEDRRMDGTVTVENASRILVDALEKFGQTAAPNRAARRSKK